ncbi:MAG: hypothetical protein H0U55_13045 [Rubrobacteraceae bacterium]|nr:hypothetical protein [Rubrobacteraceae bacterium]
MNLSEKQLRERGVFRSLEDIEGDVLEMIAYSIGTLPVGVVGREPARQFTSEEADVLKRGGLTLEVYEGKDDASTQTAERYATMMALALTEDEVQRVLGVKPSRVRQRIADRSLYAIAVGKERRFPQVQFHERDLVPGIGKVLQALPEDLHPVEVESWLTSPNPDLLTSEEEALSPREWLISGGSVSPLVAMAREL